MASEWYYHANGERNGPVTAEELQALAANGTLRPTDLICKLGMSEWIAASQSPNLVFGNPFLPDQQVEPIRIVTDRPASRSVSRSAPSGPRYPNLERYLRWLALLAVVELVLSVVIAVLFTAISVLAASRFEQQMIAVAVGCVIAVSGWISYVVMMATVELLRVVIDIESSTRRAAALLERRNA